MSYLEDIINGIETKSGIELPQDERTLIQNIVSKYEFNEESARSLAELYINTYNLPNTIWEGFSTVLNQTLEDKDQKLLGSKQLNKLLYFFHEITKFYQTHKLTQQPHLTIYSNNLLQLLCQTHNRQNQTLVSKYLEILDKLFQLDRNFLFPSHLDIDGNEDEIYKNRNDFIGTLSFPENMDEKKEEEHYITKHTDKLIKFLDKLLNYKLSDNKPIIVPQPLTNIMYYSLDKQYRQLDKLVRGTQFLSRHNSKEESLSDVLGKMIDIMSIEIPDYEIIDFLGEGAFKRVYLARSKIDPDKYVAVAVFDPEHIKKTGQLRLSKMGVDKLTPEELENTIRREFKPSKLDEIRPPYKENIINIHHVGRTERFAYMTYDPYEINVRDFISQEKINYAQIRKILLGMASGLIGCHKATIIHRDLHAGNIGLILDRTDHLAKAIISDFGQMSESLLAHNGGYSQMSPLQTRPPEQFLTKDEFEKYKQLNAHKFSEVDTFGVLPAHKVLDFELQKRANVFNFGCIAYQLITGRTPFWPTNPDGTLIEDPLKQDSNDLEGRLEIEKQILNMMETKKDPKGNYKKFLEKDQAFREAPKYLRKIITKCLMYDPLDRYDSFDKTFNDLEKESWWRFILKDEQTLTPKQKIERKYSRIFYSALGVSLIAGLLFYTQCNNWNEKTKQESSRIHDNNDLSSKHKITDINNFNISSLTFRQQLIFANQNLEFYLDSGTVSLEFMSTNVNLRATIYDLINQNGSTSFDSKIDNLQIPKYSGKQRYAFDILPWTVKLDKSGIKILDLDLYLDQKIVGSKSKPILIIDQNKKSEDINKAIIITNNNETPNYVDLSIDLNGITSSFENVGLFINDQAIFYPKIMRDYSFPRSQMGIIDKNRENINDITEFMKMYRDDLDKNIILFDVDVQVSNVNLENNIFRMSFAPEEFSHSSADEFTITVVKIDPNYQTLHNSLEFFNQYQLTWGFKEFNIKSK